MNNLLSELTKELEKNGESVNDLEWQSHPFSEMDQTFFACSKKYLYRFEENVATIMRGTSKYGHLKIVAVSQTRP